MVNQITTLPNGLRIISDQVDHLETAALGVWVGVGARHEVPHLNGISHFLEHMAFKGTVNANAKEIAERIEQVGGYINAYTTRETTAYYVRLLAGDIPMALDLLADILQFSVFHEEELEKERKVILQEISETLDTPDDLVFELFQETAYPNHPLGRSILGTADIVKSLPRQALIDYQRQNYSPNNMILAAAGKIKHDEIVRIAQERFCYLEDSNILTAQSALYTGGLKLQQKDLEQVHLVLGFKAPSLCDPLYYACAVLSTLLGGGMSSRLFQQVREHKGLAYTIYSFHSAFTDSGLLGIYAGTDQKDVAELLPVLRQELKSLSSTLTNKEITRAKAQLKSQLLMGLENTSARCEQLAHHMLIYGRSLSLAELVGHIEAVTEEDLVACIHEILQSTPTLTALGPIADESLLTDFHKNFV